MPMIPNSFFSFYRSDFDSIVTVLQNALKQISSFMTANLLTLDQLVKLNFFLLVSNNNWLNKVTLCSLDTAHSARNFGFSFHEHLTSSDQISALSKSCYSHIRQLRCIRPYLDNNTASTIATSTVHSKLDYCNSLYYNLPNTQLNHLQHIKNALACTIVRPRSPPISTLL